MVLSSRKIFAFAIIGGLLCAMSVYAYLVSLPPQRGPRVFVTSPPLEFIMELEKAEFQQGENVTIRLSVKNVGNKTIMLTWSDFNLYYDAVMYFDFYITDANDTLIYEWYRRHGALQMLLEETLNPNEELISVYPWFQTTDYPVTQVPPGTYNIRGSTRQLALTVDDQTSVITLETPTIAITIE